MPALSIRNLPASTHRALRLRAAANGRSTEAEVRAIIEQAVTPPEPVGLGTLLASIGQKFGGVDFETVRDTAPIEPANFD